METFTFFDARGICSEIVITDHLQVAAFGHIAETTAKARHAVESAIALPAIDQPGLYLNRF
ncbi:hypothetical protein D3C87_1689040 [compost metagenome]